MASFQGPCRTACSAWTKQKERQSNPKNNPANQYATYVHRLMAQLNQSEIGEDLCARAVVTGIRGKSEFEVCINGVTPPILQLVCAQLMKQSDAAALMSAHIEHHAPALLRDAAQCRLKLGAAVAAQ